MKTLTEKQKKVLDLMAKGTPINQAVLEVYDCLNSRSAYQIAFNLKKNELF